jgi:hypothetical protein
MPKRRRKSTGTILDLADICIGNLAIRIILQEAKVKSAAMARAGRISL